MMREAVAEMLAWVVLNSAFTAPTQAPRVEVKPAADFAARACPARSRCAARAYYEDGTDTVVLHEDFHDLNELQQQALILHEVVHYLQDLGGTYDGPKTCDVWFAREREAFRLQLKYLARKTSNLNVLYRMPRLNLAQCEAQRAPHYSP